MTEKIKRILENLDVDIEKVDFEKFIDNYPIIINQLKIQLSSGNWNFDSYMHGMTNGMLVVLSTLIDAECEFIGGEDLKESQEKLTNVRK